MKFVKKMMPTFVLVLWVCLSIAPAAHSWSAFDQLHGRRYNILIRKVHADYWTIGYHYIDCPPEKMNNNKALEEAMTQVLQAWLQPVRALNTGKPVVNDFRYEHKDKIHGEEAVKPFDLVVAFFCTFGISSMGASEVFPPAITMRRGTEVTRRGFMGTLLHEIGHAFGLADTCIRPAPAGDVRASKGGLARTIGHQPSSIMNIYGVRDGPMPEDDKNGIIWLYKFHHEDLPIDDCIFPNYEWESSPVGCRPKYPLIFEIKHHGTQDTAIGVLNDDPNTEINAKDLLGSTALHYAVTKNYQEFLKKLLERADLDVNAKDADGRTALYHAIKNWDADTLKKLLAREDLDVNAKDADGRTALYYAIKNWDADTENLIRNHPTFDLSAHWTLVKIAGDGQETTAGSRLSPLILAAQDERGQPMPNVKVTFTIDRGKGMLGRATATTDAEGRARTTLALGWIPGTTTVRATAEGIQDDVLFTATATAPPEPISAEDVNADRVVDAEDLVLVASSIGTVPLFGAMPNTDVNGDTEVNTEDVLLVLAALEGVPAVPSVKTQWTVESLQRWIAEVKHRGRNDARLQRGLFVLEQLLAEMLPTQTILLLNYPNPFNPETWIPYQLAAAAEVRIDIYAMNGVLVRTLALGHQAAGFYRSRGRAAYWDGRNEIGEPVVSGIYFYRLSAGTFTATRKMVIRK